MEARRGEIVRAAVKLFSEQGYLRSVNAPLLVYQYVLFAHAWALKSWAFRNRYSLDAYVREGLKLLVDPFLTAKGRRSRR